MPDQKKLKVYKVYPEDHLRLERLGTRDQTQPDIIHNLISETEWLPKLELAYAKASALTEEGSKTGKSSLIAQGAGVALSVLKAYIEYIKERSRNTTNSSKEIDVELIEPIAKKSRELFDLFARKEISNEECAERLQKIIDEIDELIERT